MAKVVPLALLGKPIPLGVIDAKLPCRRMPELRKRARNKVSQVRLERGAFRDRRKAVASHLDCHPFKGKARDIRVNDLDLSVLCFRRSDKTLHGEPRRVEYLWIEIAHEDDGTLLSHDFRFRSDAHRHTGLARLKGTVRVSYCGILSLSYE